MKKILLGFLVLSLAFALLRMRADQASRAGITGTVEHGSVDSAQQRGSEPSELSQAVSPLDDGSTLGRIPARDAASHENEIRVLIESDYRPLEPLSVQVYDQEGSAVGLVRKTYDLAIWTDLASGPFKAEAWASGWYGASKEIGAVEGSSATEVRLHVHPKNWITGNVVTLRRVAAVPEFTIQPEFRSPPDGIGIWPGRKLTFQSPEGHFAVGGAPANAESIRLVFSAAGYLPTTSNWLPITPIEGLVIELGREGESESRVMLRTIDTVGAPAKLTKLTLVDSNTSMASVQLSERGSLIYSAADITGGILDGTARAETGDDGRAELRTRYKGVVRMLVVPIKGRAFLTDPFELKHGHVVDLGDIAISSGASIEGRVWIGEQSATMLVRRVDAVHSSGASITSSLKDDGEFRIDGLEAGLYRVSAIAEQINAEGQSFAQFPVATTSVRVEAEGVERVDLHYGVGMAGYSVGGMIERIDEIDETRVVVLDVDLRPVSLCFAGSDGRFRLTDVPAGEYTLAVMARSDRMDRFAATWQSIIVPQPSAEPIAVKLSHSQVEIIAPQISGRSFEATARTQNFLFDRLISEAMFGVLDSDGRSVIWGMPVGTYRFRIDGTDREIAIPAEGGAFRIEL